MDSFIQSRDHASSLNIAQVLSRVQANVNFHDTLKSAIVYKNQMKKRKEKFRRYTGNVIFFPQQVVYTRLYTRLNPSFSCNHIRGRYL